MESSSRTLVCSVLFLDIIEYSKKPVAEQLQLKQSFNRMLATALEQVPQRDRIILDTGDGAAVTFLGDPEDALFAALTVRNMTTDVPVRLGVNLGPVRLVKDLNGQMNIIGDGINVAQRVMGFAQPGQLLVSRSFYEVVSCLSRDYLKLFRHEGSRTDKHVREHEVYSVVGGALATRRLAHTEPRLFRGDGAWLAGTGPFGLKRSALVAAPLAFLLMVVGGVAARSVMEPQPQQQSDAGVANTPVRDAPVAAPAPVPTESTGPASDQKPTAAEEPITPPTAPDRQSPDKRRVAKKPSPPSTPAHAKPAIAAAAAPVTSPLAPSQPPQPAAEEKATVAPGRIDVVVLPWGEIVVDGRVRGVSPPLRMLEIPAGSHTIELRNTTFPKRVERIEVKAGESVRIRHRFR